MTHEDIKQWVAAQDWNLRDAEISRQTGVPYAVVRQRRLEPQQVVRLTLIEFDALGHEVLGCPKLDAA